MASSRTQSGNNINVDRSTASATSPLREELAALPEGSGYMSDDSNARNLTRGASRKLNKTLNKLNPFKVLKSRCFVCWGYSSVQLLRLPPHINAISYFDGYMQQRAATAGGRWFNPEEFTQQKVHFTCHPEHSKPVRGQTQRCYPIQVNARVLVLLACHPDGRKSSWNLPAYYFYFERKYCQ